MLVVLDLRICGCYCLVCRCLLLWVALIWYCLVIIVTLLELAWVLPILIGLCVYGFIGSLLAGVFGCGVISVAVGLCICCFVCGLVVSCDSLVSFEFVFAVG